MSVHPDLMALRGDDTPQRRDQIAMSAAADAWRDRAQFRQLEREVRVFAQGTGLGSLPALTALFERDDRAARALVTTLITPLLGVLRDHPLAAVPLRHHGDDRSALLVLCQSGGAALALQVIEPCRHAVPSSPRTVTFTPGLVHERVLAGAADVDLVTLAREWPDRADLSAERGHLVAGDCRARDTGRQTRLIRHAGLPLVMLRLQRRGQPGEVAREYDLADGRLLRQAAASPRDTRLELVAALLGRMGRRDAAPLLAAMADEEPASSLRWQSLKESLALDTGEGFKALCRIANRAGDELAAPAAALRGQLIESYPQLKEIPECQ